MAKERICKNCGEKYISRAATSSYCSLTCFGKANCKRRYELLQIPFQKNCVVCNEIFIVLGKAKLKNKKTCSNECRNKLQGIHLQQYPKSHPRPECKRKPQIIKNCINCGKEFKIDRKGNARQQCCSRYCGNEIGLKSRTYKISKEDLIVAIEQSYTLNEIAEKLKCSHYTIRRRLAEFDISYKKTKLPKLRSDGYHSYKSDKNHRRIFEAYHNVKLLPRQGVHHIDGVKVNNDIENLIQTENTSEHTRIHGSLQKVAFELFRKGNIIGFDRETKKYFLIS